MFVKDHMTWDPYTITKDTPISKALEIMDSKGFHRLPVVDKDGKLIGLITTGLISGATGSSYTSLSIYELNYLLSRTKASDIMIKNVKTIGPDVLLEEAASKMIDNTINVLPVVDENNKVIGIITEKDIFQAFIELMGYKKQGTRFVIRCDDHPGAFVECARLFAQENANVENLAIYHNDRGTEVVVKATGEVSVERMTEVLREGGYEVTSIVQTKKAGE